MLQHMCTADVQTVVVDALLMCLQASHHGPQFLHSAHGTLCMRRPGAVAINLRHLVLLYTGMPDPLQPEQYAGVEVEVAIAPVHQVPFPGESRNMLTVAHGAAHCVAHTQAWPLVMSGIAPANAAAKAC
jgi:hypothetical protein